MSRPRRLYINSKGKYYYIVNGKKKYIKIPEGMSPKQVQTINIKNIVGGPARRMKKRAGRRVQPKYDKKLVKGEDMQKTSIKTEGGLPTYIFTPQKKFLSLGDISTKSDDTGDKQLVNLLKDSVPVLMEGFKKLALPAPEQQQKLLELEGALLESRKALTDVGQTMKAIGSLEEDLYGYVEENVQRKLLESEPYLKKYIQSTIEDSKKPSLDAEKIKLIQQEKKRLKESLEETRRSREGTPAATPLREEDDYSMPASFPPLSKTVSEEEPSIYKESDFKKVFKIRYLKGLDKDKEDKKFTKFIDSQKTSEGKTVDPTSWNAETLINFGKLIGLQLKKGTKRDILQKEIAKKLQQEGFGDESGDDGLYNDQIETIMKKRIKNFVPVVASDQVNSLLNHVQKGDKFFAAVVNTEPSESSGRHWRCIVIDNRDDFTSAEYFDPLAEKSQPEQPLLDVMRKIAKRMNPEKYFKYKFNKLQRQNFNKSNCGYHCMRFIEDRYNGVPFSEATGWDSYMKRQKGSGAPDDSQDGEGDLKSYQKMIEKKFSSYL